VWLTDLAVADRLALGLTSLTLSCDRTAYRFEVADVNEVAEPWVKWAHRHRIPSAVRDGLDGNPGAQPLRWWVAEQPVPVLR
jgi:hypothetical protein